LVFTMLHSADTRHVNEEGGESGIKRGRKGQRTRWWTPGHAQQGQRAGVGNEPFEKGKVLQQ